MKNWFMAQIDSTKIWWSNNYQQIKVKVKQWAKKLDSGFEKFAKIVNRLIIIGVILNIVASYFCPEFPERFPIIYGWFDGWLQLGEFAFKATLNGIYALFTGHWSEFWTKYNLAFQQLLQQFINWLSNIHF